MRNIYVIAHPEATHHIEKVVGGWHDSQLTQLGQNDAVSLGEELRNRIPENADLEIFTSDLHRALQTANVLGDRLNVDPTIDRRLREKSYGEADGKPQEWLEQRFIPPPVIGDRMRHDEGFLGVETRQLFAERIYSVMDEILESACEHQIIVTHGFAVTFVLASWIRMPIDSLDYVNFRVRSGSITCLREDDFFHNRQIASLNETDHLGK